MEITIIIGVAALIIGALVGFAIFRFVATSKYKQIVTEAGKEAEVIKQKKLLEVNALEHQEELQRRRNS